MKTCYQDVDRGWAWVVMLAAFSSQFVSGVLSYGIGVIHVELLNVFDEDIVMTSLVGSVFCSLLALLGPLVSYVINKWSCRVATMLSGIFFFVGMSLSFFAPNLKVLLVSYGIIGGTALSLSVVSAVIVVGYSFEKYRGIAVGFNVTGAGVGMFAAGPITQTLIDTYGLRGAFLMLGAFGAHCLIFGALMRPTKIELFYKTVNREDSKERKPMCDLSSLALFKDKCMLCIFISTFLWNTPYTILIIYMPKFASTMGVSAMESALLITTIGLGSTANRLLAGSVLGPGGIDPVLLYFGFLGVLGISTVAFPFYCASYIGQTVYSLLFGIYSGGLIVLLNPLCMELVGISKLSSAVGFVFGTAGVGGLLGPPIAGFIIDLRGSYLDVFYISGIIFLLAAFSVLLSTLWRRDAISEEKAASIIDFKESRFLSGSAYLTGSYNVIIEAKERERLKEKDHESLIISNGIGSPSIESLFLARHLKHVSQDSIATPNIYVDDSNLTATGKKKYLYKPTTSQKEDEEQLALHCNDVTIVCTEVKDHTFSGEL